MRQLSSSYSESDREPQSSMLAAVEESSAIEEAESQIPVAKGQEVSDTVSQPQRSFKWNAVAGALAMSIVPTLMVGGITIGNYQQLLDRMSPSAENYSAVKEQQMTLYVVTGSVAVLAGAIATLFAYRTLRPLRLAILTTNRLVKQLSRVEQPPSTTAHSNAERLESNLKFISAQTLKLWSQKAVEVNPVLTAEAAPQAVANPEIIQTFIDANLAIAQDLSTTAFDQTKRVDASYTNLVEITNTTQEILGHLRRTVEQEQSMGQAAQVGHRTIDQIKDHHASMWVSLIEAATQVQSLDEPVQRLDQILSHVSTLTAKIKIKAMNAALEAARIGEMGEEFAGIGEDLHTLVRQLDEGIVEVNQLTAGLKTDVQATAAKMTLGQQQASSGKLLMVVAQQQLSQVVTLSDQIGTMSEQVIQGVTQQAQTSTTASQTMVEIATLTSQVSEQAALLTEAIEQLSRQNT